MSRLVCLIIALILSMITALGDFFVKKASLQSRAEGMIWLIAGSVIYAATAFGWYFILKRMKLSTAVVIFSASLILFVVFISIFYFKEKLTVTEILGVFLAIMSVCLLYRFI
jgi:drug/metabolite transporter (DMT)-like permease